MRVGAGARSNASASDAAAFGVVSTYPLPAFSRIELVGLGLGLLGGREGLGLGLPGGADLAVGDGERVPGTSMVQNLWLFASLYWKVRIGRAPGWLLEVAFAEVLALVQFSLGQRAVGDGVDSGRAAARRPAAVTALRERSRYSRFRAFGQAANNRARRP